MHDSRLFFFESPALDPQAGGLSAFIAPLFRISNQHFAMIAASHSPFSQLAPVQIQPAFIFLPPFFCRQSFGPLAIVTQIPPNSHQFKTFRAKSLLLEICSGWTDI